jgi:hypothetical protein
LSLPFDELEFYGLFLMPELVLASLFEARIYLLEFDWAGKAGAEEESC